MIGDPSGKDAERALLTREQVDANIQAQQKIFSRVITFDAGEPNDAMLVNNADWLCDLHYLDVLRDIGKHFSVNAMIQKDSVRERLHHREQGISYTEFSYMVLQAYDFLHLRRTHDCTVQIAGSDQYGNIVCGIDLIRRDMQDEDPSETRGYGITAPLVTKSDGSKFGKSESGAIWLTADRTSPWAFYQFWRNTADSDVGRYLRFFTFLDKPTIEEIETQHDAAPHERLAQRRLAAEVTQMLHGADELSRVEAAAEALFSGDISSLDEAMLEAVFADVPASSHPRASIEGEGMLLVDLLSETSLASSKREARELLAGGSIAMNGTKVDKSIALDRRVLLDDLLHGRTILLRRGKKAWHCTEWNS
ncbi:MAG: tyrosine--tRNA ligase [Phycisphaerales bacterium]|nr:tyrosine--tRNA ligase [Phycisphaerales bacterium]